MLQQRGVGTSLVALYVYVWFLYVKYLLGQKIEENENTES